MLQEQAQLEELEGQVKLHNQEAGALEKKKVSRKMKKKLQLPLLEENQLQIIEGNLLEEELQQIMMEHLMHLRPESLQAEILAFKEKLMKLEEVVTLVLLLREVPHLLLEQGIQL